jgi:protein-S-isoprenylcysteine O-methyltransferase Ste14
MDTKKALLRSSIVLYFIIAFEVLIMISPFAGFFYSVFNPVLLAFAQHAGTRWLSAFYLPHMVLPQDPFLQFLRVTGSVLFVLGLAVFLICAAQIYTAKFRRKGAVLGGLYSSIRHPQYLALAVAGLGLSILWPRFLTIVLWLVMVFVYYFLTTLAVNIAQTGFLSPSISAWIPNLVFLVAGIWLNGLYYFKAGR